MSKISFSIDKRFWAIIFLVLACSLAAGSLGGIFVRNYLSDQSGFAGDLNLNSLRDQGSSFVIRDAKNVIVNQDLKITETINSLKPIFVRVFKEIPANSSGEYYNLNEPLFMGLIITADGWVIALAPKDQKTDFKFSDYVAISGSRQVYKIDKLVSSENFPGSPLVFHLARAANLPVKKIVSRSELSLGETLLAVNNLNNIWPTNISALKKSQSVLSSDSPSARLDLAGSEDNNFKNSFVFDLGGNLAAVIGDDRGIIPAFSYDYLVDFLVPNKNVVRPSLGVHYLDLSQIKTTFSNLDSGAWLYPLDKEPAIIKDGAASKVGLKESDIITWVNNIKIDASNDLADLLLAYHAGDKITLTYERDGSERVVEVILGSFK